MSLSDQLEKIRDIMLNHVGWDNTIKSKDLADQIGIQPGASNVKIRTLLTKTMIKYHLPVGSAGTKGYYIMDKDEDLRNNMSYLESRIAKMESRKTRLKLYFEEFHGLEPEDSDLNIDDDEDEDDFF